MKSWRLIYLTLAFAAFVLLISWFLAFPIKTPFNYNDIFVESSILALIIAGNYFIHVLMNPQLKLGWAILTLGFLVDIFDEFTKEPR